MNTSIKSKFIGCGHYLPQKIVTNDDLAKIVDTSHDWIVPRTGIHQRHFASDTEVTSDLATKAAENALKSAGLKPSDIDLIVLATSTPDRTFPATATIVQHKLGCKGFAFDVNATCSGYIMALQVADQYIRNGTVKNALVIGAEIFSRIIDMEDRRSCILFGDGAGAVVITANTQDDSGIIDIVMESDGQYFDILHTDGGPSYNGKAGKVRILGQEVFKQAVKKLAKSAEEIMIKNNIEKDQIDWMIPHQANIRIIQAMAEKMNMSMDKVITTVDKHANTSAASIPLALSIAHEEGKIKSGDLILHEAFGAGIIWGSALIRW